MTAPSSDSWASRCCCASLPRQSQRIRPARAVRWARARRSLRWRWESCESLPRGLHPAVLTSGGLGVALQSLAGRAPVPVAVTGVPADRLPEAVEAAAYYVVAEALTNVAKYAGATAARVHVELTDASAVIEVSDDGVGGADAADGTGLRGLADRVEALGGSLDVQSPPGGGTIVQAAIPCRPAREEALDVRDPSSVQAADDVFTAVKGRVVERGGGVEIPLRVVVAEDALLLRAGVIRVAGGREFRRRRSGGRRR
jgi:Histidine kinase-, DNA gyrase B-, and HSP90-like ATPase